MLDSSYYVVDATRIGLAFVIRVPKTIDVSLIYLGTLWAAEKRIRVVVSDVTACWVVPIGYSMMVWIGQDAMHTL